MNAPTVFGLAILPWLIEALWVWRWVPIHARQLRKQQALEEVFGPGYFDMNAPPPWPHVIVFVLYHLPVVLLGRVIVPAGWQKRWSWLVFILAMVGTPLLYSGVILWLGNSATESSAVPDQAGL